MVLPCLHCISEALVQLVHRGWSAAPIFVAVRR
jgi:hypothetical protein